MLAELYSSIIYFLHLTFATEATWIILPLFISTVLMIAYYGIYREEKADWNTNFSNSFVLVFVSLALFQYIYSINNAGGLNFTSYWGKTIASLLLLSIGLILVRFNLEHLLPMNAARYISSPITVNLLAYAIILIVYSKDALNLLSFIALLIIVLVLMGLLLLVKFPAMKISKSMRKEKEEEIKRDAKELQFEIQEMKKELSYRKKELRVLLASESRKKKKI
jgi:phosphatidylserine synthase